MKGRNFRKSFANETQYNRERRNTNNRLRNQELRSVESVERNEIRLEANRLRNRASRATENPDDLRVRLEKNRERASTSRENETHDNKRARLNGNRVRATTSRQNAWSNLNLEAFNYDTNTDYRFDFFYIN